MSNISLKCKIYDYVESLGGSASWKQIHNFILLDRLKVNGNDPAVAKKYRGYFASYFSDSSWGGYNYGKSLSNPGGFLLKQTGNDIRYLVKVGRGKYSLRYIY